MDSDSGSAQYRDRNVAPQRIPDSRDPHIATATPVLSNFLAETQRQKRSTDVAFANDDNHSNEENLRVLRQRTSPFTSIKSGRSKIKTKTTSHVFGGDSPTTVDSSSDSNGISIAPRNAGKSFNNLTHESPGLASLDRTENPTQFGTRKSFIQARTPLRLLEDKYLSNESLTRSDSYPFHSKDNLPLFNIGNVELFSSSGIFNDLFPQDQPYIVIADNDAIDDSISHWDMEPIPSIPDAFESLEEPLAHRTAARDPPTLPFPTPFSEPLDDDSDSSDEASSQVSKLPVKIVREDMAIRKAKHRSPRSPSLSRSAFRPFPSVPSSDNNNPYNAPPTIILESDVKDPFYPLPLRRLGHSPAERPYPWAEPSAKPAIDLSSTTPFSPLPSPVPTMNRRFQEPYKLQASDCELSVAFPQTSHYEVWDEDDNSFVSCPLLLCIIDKGTHTGTGTLLAEPDVTLLEITCDDVPVPTPMLRYDIYNEYSIIYSDNKTGTAKDARRSRTGISKAGSPASSHPATGGGGLKLDIGVRHPPKGKDEIEIDGRWTRIYARPRPRHLAINDDHGRAGAIPSIPPSLFGGYSIANPLGLPPFMPPPLPPSLSFSSDTSFSSECSPFLSTPSVSASPSFNLSPSPSPPQSSRPPSLILTHAEATGQTGFGATARGFYLKVWIPIPLRLFIKRETRLFHIKARVWLNGDEEKSVVNPRSERKNSNGSWPEGLRVEGGTPIPGGTKWKTGIESTGFHTFLGGQLIEDEGNGMGNEDEDSGSLALFAVGEMSVSHLRSWRSLA